LPMKNKHLSLDDRIEIQSCLDRGMTFKAIAKRVGKDQTTISKEVKKHIAKSPSDVKHMDAGGNPEHKVCPLLLKAPFVCNPCKKRHYRCAYPKQMYSAKAAQSEYRELLAESREGIPLNKERFYEIDAVISAGIKKGQHLYHIMESNSLDISKSTAYRHLHRGYLSVCKLEFPRVVKFKARKQKAADYVPKAAKIGRTYDDFLNYVSVNGISSWTEMDTLIGRIGGKTILTFDLTFCNFMFGILLNDRTSVSVTEAIQTLKSILGDAGSRFGDIFPLILTDNGGEFANVHAIEADMDGGIETMLFFCDPQMSSQKPKVEKNHTLFRDIAPTGTSFDGFTQDIVNLIFSHVNGVKRKRFNGKSPYDLFTFTFGIDIASLLGVSYVHPDDVVQSPKLLKGLT